MKKRKQFSRTLLAAKLKQRGMTRDEFVLKLMNAAPKELKPSNTYILNTLTGKIARPSCDYVFLMAYVLECTVDDLGEVVK